VNVLDENIPESQRERLRKRRVAARQIGRDLGRKGMKDREILPLLHGLTRPTFFTLDADFYDRRLCHERYCLVHLDVDEDEVAKFINRVLRHRRFDTWAKRSGRVLRVSLTGIASWRVRKTEEGQVSWR
jgi:hypothetical protein